MRERFDWLKPSRLWQAHWQDFRQPEASACFQPQLLKFESDDFMEEFFKATAAPKADDFKKAILPVASESEPPLKLFQPAHGCFYLVCASLCCRQAGFPDRLISTPDGENVFFVLRKFINGAEYGWVMDDTRKVDGAELRDETRKRWQWQPLNGQGQKILEKEERLPLLKTQSGDQRCLWFGYLPIASRETYTVPPTVFADTPDAVKDIRLEDLKARFITPLVKTIISKPPLPKEELPSPLSTIDSTDHIQARNLSVYILLDLWEFFELYLRDVTEALSGKATASFSGDQAQAKVKLLELLQKETLNGDLKLAAALRQVAEKHDELNQLGDRDMLLEFNKAYNLATVPNIDDPEGFTKRLLGAVEKALPTQLPPVELPKFTAAQPDKKTYYAVRCVYERPQCELVPYTISQPSAPFQLAPYFDSDAPGRPIRIPLPTDVSIAGLRKFNKNVTFLISESLQRKISRLTGKEKDLLKDSPSLNPEQGGGLAFICSFSIQIIFIVAFMLLLVFVIVFNLVFWWIAFFRICLPVPKKLLSG